MFADNMRNICNKIRKNPNTLIKVVVGKPDYFCDKCPYWHIKECVQSKKIGKWVVSQDKRVLKYLELKENSVHKAKDIFNLSMKKINPKTISKVCNGCIFLENCIKVGVNNSFKKDLNKL